MICIGPYHVLNTLLTKHFKCLDLFNPHHNSLKYMLNTIMILINWDIIFKLDRGQCMNSCTGVLANPPRSGYKENSLLKPRLFKWTKEIRLMRWDGLFTSGRWSRKQVTTVSSKTKKLHGKSKNSRQIYLIDDQMAGRRITHRWLFYFNIKGWDN